MSHAHKADKLLIKPAAGARPAPPHTRGRIIPKARTRRPVTRRVTRGTATTRLATVPDRPTRRLLQSPDGEAASRPDGALGSVSAVPVARSATGASRIEELGLREAMPGAQPPASAAETRSEAVTPVTAPRS